MSVSERSNRRLPVSTWPLVLLVVYAAAVIAGTLAHTPWRDETQAWLVARDLGPAGLFRAVRYEGHPMLWYLLLSPFARAGLPFAAAQAINVAVALGAAALVCFASPFRLWQKAVLLAAYPFVYYGIFTRNYGLAVVFLLLLAWMHTRRFRWPIAYGCVLVLLANTTVPTAMLAGPAAIAWAFELTRDRRWNARSATGAAVVGLGGAMLVAQMLPAADAAYGGWRSLAPAEALDAVASALHALVFGHRLEVPEPLGAAIGASLIVACLWVLRRHLPTAVAIAAAVAGVGLVHVFKYELSLRHFMLVPLFLVYGLWIRQAAMPDAAGARAARASRAERFVVAALFVSLATTAVLSQRLVLADLRRPLSGSRAMAGVIAANGIEAPIAAYRMPVAAGVLAFLPGRSFWYAEVEAWGTFSVWTREYAESKSLDQAEILRRVREQFPGGEAWVLLSNPMRSPQEHGFALAHAEDDARREKLFLYRPSGQGQRMASSGCSLASSSQASETDVL